MSTKTTFKRVALVTVAALGFGMLSALTTPAGAVAQALTVSAGPNDTTSSVTVVGTGDQGALIRLDVTGDTTTAAGLQANETITATITGVPTSVTAKTVAANGGAFTDSAAWTTPMADLVMVESRIQTSGVPASTAAASTTSYTDWSKVVVGGAAPGKATTYIDTPTAGSKTDGLIGSTNSGFINMDGRTDTTLTSKTKSYYVSITPRTNAAVVDQGAYTITFVLTDANQNVRGTKTITVDFVSTKAKSGAKLSLATSGTFLVNTALLSTNATAAAYATLTLTNRDGGAVRTSSGGAPDPTVSIQNLALIPVADTMTVTAADDGISGADFGENTTNMNLIPQNGVYGLTATLPATASSTTQTYQFYALYGNATPATAAFTLYAPNGSGSADTTKTDVQLTATGIKATDGLKVSNLTATKAYTLPTTATAASLKFWIADSTDTATGGALITVKPTWSAYGSNAVTPATSTTGTVYTTDAGGNFTVSVTNTTPVDGAVLTLVLSGGVAFGAGTNTVTLTWKDPVATTISVADPVSGAYVLTGSTNVTTVKVTDQFGNAVANQGVSVAIPGTTSANYSATATISPIKTGADGTATYSLVGGATTATADTVSFNCIPTACAAAATVTYNYVTTLPVVATIAGYYGMSWDTAATLTPSTGIYATGTTKLLIKTARDISVASLTDASTTDDQVALRFTALTSAGVSATGAVVTVTAGAGGHIVGSSGLPVKSRNYVVGATGTAVINVLATGTGDVTFTATSGTVTATATLKVANATTDARFVKMTSATTGAANGSGVPVTVTVTDRYGNVVSGVAVNVVASGVGSFMGGSITNSYTTDASGTYTFLANTVVSDGGVAKFTATSGTTADFTSTAGKVGSTSVDSTLAAGNSSTSVEITFAAGASATDVAQAATDAAAEATDAANAATDAANAAAEAADAATAAAQDAADAVAALSTQVSEMIDALKKQITALTNLVIKIQKKVKA